MQHCSRFYQKIEMLFTLLYKYNYYQKALRMSSLSNQLSVFIPRCDYDITDSFITETFRLCLDLGAISRIDRISKLDRNSVPYVSMYIHFDNVYSNAYVESFRNGEIRQLYYSDTQFWTVLPNTASKHTSGDRKLRIQLFSPIEIVKPKAMYPVSIASSLTYPFPKHILVDAEQYNIIVNGAGDPVANSNDDEDDDSLKPIDIDSPYEHDDYEHDDYEHDDYEHADYEHADYDELEDGEIQIDKNDLLEEQLYKYRTAILVGDRR
jgi:hypothetical protein